MKFISLLIVTIWVLLLSPSSSFKLESVFGGEQTNGDFDNAYIVHRAGYMELVLKDRIVRLLKVPDVMQATRYTCGPSSLSAVLNYFHVVGRESHLATLANTSPNSGTSPSGLVAAAKAMNVTAQIKEGMNVSQLETEAIAGRPTILLLQAWSNTPVDYTNDFDDGHYVVFIGSDSEYAYFEDPWIIGSIAYTSKRKLLDRWHDTIFTEQRKCFGLGIVFSEVSKDTPPIR